ncbi:MAG TPA: S46 family peptidase [Planctomycetota bacterium]|nr:S46 family peptidase [Planctomycetota bacterium]
MHLTPLVQLTAAVVALGATFPRSAALPDEGMWPFDSLPLQLLKEKYDFVPTPEWLDHVRLGSVRFDTGGSGSFVSPHGLVMTNHHVALSTIQLVSTQEKDWVKDGFSARLYGSELKSQELKLRQLIEIRDVTKEVLAAKAEDTSPNGNDWRKKVTEMCAEITDATKHIQADSVPLYNGNQYRIYVYHTYEDVRVVYAPEKQVAFFGGDLDNFTYPRYDLDYAFFRVYEDDKPIDSSKWYFKWSEAGAKPDDLIFVSGHPGGTERLLTYEEMEFQRDLPTPAIVRLLKARCDAMKEKMDEDPKAAFELRDEYFSASNSLKAYQGHLAGLLDKEMMAKMQARDGELIAKSGKPEVKEAFEFIAAAMDKLRERYKGDRVDLRALMRDVMKTSEQTCAKAKATINQARFDVYGTAIYPDAGFTLRLSFGTVKGYESGTTLVPPKTTFNGLYDRNASFDNQPPFDLPQTWLDAKSKLNLNTPINFVCTADIIGGNSGSPILNRNAEIVGLVFDGNIESLPGNFWFDERVNRCVGVHSAGMMEAMVKVYGETELAKEILGK